MPKKNEKDKILNFLIEEAANDIISEIGVESDDNAIEEILDELEENMLVVSLHRRGFASILQKCDIWRNDILATMDEDRFRQMLRVGRKQFFLLVNMIKNDVEFAQRHACKQFSIELQLAIVLFRLGSSGESASFRKIGTLFGVGDGGTISKITTRIFKVFLKIQSKHIYWPDENERSQLVSNTFNELPFCIGYIDGTEIKMAEAPVVEHTLHFSRNHIYSLKAQVVCDYKMRVRHVVVGSPGSWHDSRILKNSSLYLRKEEFFSSQQWIAGDSAYPLCDWLIVPYRSNAKQLNRKARIDFNLRHSKYRVRVEHCFGILKERFGSLKQLRMRLSNEKNHKLCCDWFIVCCILHNVLIENNDNISQFDNIDNTLDENSNSIDLGEDTETSELKRQAIYALMFT